MLLEYPKRRMRLRSIGISNARLLTNKLCRKANFFLAGGSACRMAFARYLVSAGRGHTFAERKKTMEVPGSGNRAGFSPRAFGAARKSGVLIELVVASVATRKKSQVFWSAKWPNRGNPSHIICSRISIADTGVGAGDHQGNPERYPELCCFGLSGRLANVHSNEHDKQREMDWGDRIGLVDQTGTNGAARRERATQSLGLGRERRVGGTRILRD